MSDFSTDFRLSMQRALLGNIHPSVRAIAMGWDDGVAHARFLLDHAPGEDDLELVSEIETEVLADFAEVTTDFLAEEVPGPGFELREGERWWAYVRYLE